MNKLGTDTFWNVCYSILLAGGGIKEGLVFGASDRTGSWPDEQPTSPGDIIATLYHLLGVNPNTSIYDVLGRPHPLVPTGRVMGELISQFPEGGFAGKKAGE